MAGLSQMSFILQSLSPRLLASLRSKWMPLISGHGRGNLLVYLDCCLGGQVSSRLLSELEQPESWHSTCRRKTPKLLQRRRWFVICLYTLVLSTVVFIFGARAFSERWMSSELKYYPFGHVHDLSMDKNFVL